MSRRPIALAATHIAALGAGYVLAPKQPVDTEVKHTGYFTVDTKQVLATTVESLRAENQLLVFSYKGTAKVSAGRTFLWLFGGEQELIVPAVVSYYLDLSRLSLGDVTYDERAKLVRVALPPVTVADVAFQPENATTTNGGVLTWSEAQVEALRKANYANARRAVVAQAQQPGLVDEARRQARADVEGYFAIPLRIAGMLDVKVAATMRWPPPHPPQPTHRGPPERSAGPFFASEGEHAMPISVRSSSDLARALDWLMEPGIRQLLAIRRDRLIAGDIARIFVVRPYDSLAAVEAAAGLALARGSARYRRVTRHPRGIIRPRSSTRRARSS